MKVVQVVPRLEAGGVERGTVEVAKYLVDQGHQAIVVSGGGRLIQELETHRVRHVTMDVGVKSLKIFQAKRQFDSFLRTENPDVVHGRSRLSDWLCYQSLKSIRSTSKPRFVTSVHGLHSVSRYSSIIGRGERVEAVSHCAKQYLLDNYPEVDPELVRVIPRGIDPQFYHPNFAPEEGWKLNWDSWMSEVNPQKLPVLSIVARLTRLKGHQDFLQVIEQLHQQGLPVVGFIVGGADEKHQSYMKKLLERVQNSPTLRSHVQFLGHRSDAREVVSQSNFVLSLSNTPESFGRTVLEALSLGIPVVGFEHGGVGEILDQVFPEGKAGIKDIQGVVDRIKTLHQQPASIKPHNFTLKSMCELTLSMYLELMT